jgi:hypothetical protein
VAEAAPTARRVFELTGPLGVCRHPSAWRWDAPHDTLGCAKHSGAQGVTSRDAMSSNVSRRRIVVTVEPSWTTIAALGNENVVANGTK